MPGNGSPPQRGFAFLTSEPEGPLVGAALRVYLVGSRAIVVLIAAATTVCFLPVVTATYGFVDDYQLLALADGFGPDPILGDIIDAYGGGGRPLEDLSRT